MLISFSLIITIILCFIPFTYFYINSFKLLKYYKAINSSFFLKSYLISTFSFLFFFLGFVFFDIITTNHKKEILFVKESLGMVIISLFLINILLVFPYIINYFYFNFKHGLFFYLYLFFLFFFNFLSFTNNPNIETNYGFDLNVPNGLAKYAFINGFFSKIFYFNLGLVLALGKFLGFTYMPFGMSKFTNNLLFKYQSPEQDNDTITNEFQRKLSYNSSSEDSSSESDESQLLDHSSPSNKPNPKNNVIKFIFGSHKNNDHKIDMSFIEKKDIDYLSYFKSKENQMKLITFLMGIISFSLIVLIIFTKIIILYTKLFHNICGIKCGLLAHRFNTKILTLQTITSSLIIFSSNKFFKYENFLLTLLIIFRTITVVCSFKHKGISFLNTIIVKQSEHMSQRNIYVLITLILYTGITLIYDFTYLLPDYVRFSTLDVLCDFSQINISYCGVSFFGLLFIRISMNYFWFMVWDIVSSCIFIINSTIWMFKLLIFPLMSDWISLRICN